MPQTVQMEPKIEEFIKFQIAKEIEKRFSAWESLLDSIKLEVADISDEKKQRIWDKKIERLRMMVQELGIFKGKTKKQVLTNLRKSREKIWQEQYAPLYPNLG